MDYVIVVSKVDGRPRLQEYRDRQCLTPPMREFREYLLDVIDTKPHVVLLRFTDRETVTQAAYCMVAVRASQIGVDGEELRRRCGIWGVTDRDFVAWIESQGGELYRNDVPGVYFLSGYEIREGSWCCKSGDHYGEGRSTFEAVASALYKLSKAIAVESPQPEAVGV